MHRAPESGARFDPQHWSKPLPAEHSSESLCSLLRSTARKAADQWRKRASPSLRCTAMLAGFLFLWGRRPVGVVCLILTVGQTIGLSRLPHLNCGADDRLVSSASSQLLRIDVAVPSRIIV